VSWLAITAGYLIGSLPFGYWLVLWNRGVDLRSEGSGNLGATNALRVAGASTGLATLILDVLKGYLAVELALGLGVSQFVVGAVALAAVVGHSFPPWLRFRGGKGVATAAGALVGVTPAALSVAGVAFVLVLALSRFVSLGSIAAAATVPVAHIAVVGYDGSSSDGSVILWIGLISLLVVARHHANLRRLWRGEEPRLGREQGG
jgi:glycerol-3-phosphate acyltransferase PlsY